MAGRPTLVREHPPRTLRDVLPKAGSGIGGNVAGLLPGPGRIGPADNGTRIAASNARQRDHYSQLFFRDIDYIDHETHDPRSHGVPEQAFLKRRKFSDEREIRLARFI